MPSSDLDPERPLTRARNDGVVASTETTSIDIVESMDSVEFDPHEGVYRATYDPGRDRTSHAVVAVVAAATDTDPVALAPLYSSIDAEALNELFSSGASETLRCSFLFEGFDVAVSGDGTVVARPTDAASPE